MATRASFAGICVSVVAVMASGCGPDVEHRRRQHLERGDRYTAEQNLDAAIIEYRSAVQEDPRFGEAYRKLSATYLRRGDQLEALQAAVAAADLLPDVSDAQLDAGNLLLLTGRFDLARERAARVLVSSPTNTRAHVLLGNATAGLKNVDGAIRELEEAIRLDPNQSGIYTGLAALKVSQGERDEAERIFKRAIEIDPRSVTARLALAQFYWSAGRLPYAERTIRAAIQMMPNDARANVSLAVLYQATGRSAEAEPYLRAAVQAEPSNAIVSLLLADYYITHNRPHEAVPLLEPVATDRRLGPLANLRLAKIARLEGRINDGLILIEGVLRADPRNVTALALESDLLRQDDRLEEASKAAETAVAANPSSAEALLARGRVLAAQGRYDSAVAAFGEVLRLDPRTVAARIELARLKLRDDVAGALALATEATRAAPESIDARLMLARVLVQKADYREAQRVLGDVVKTAPAVAAVHAQMGLLLARTRDTPRARAAYLRALEIEPLHLEALEGITALDIASNRAGDALQRFERLLPQAPRSGGLLTIAGSAYATAGDLGKAETTLLRAIEVDPTSLGAYSLLGRVYVAQKRLAQARAEFERVAASQDRPVAALTIIGMIDLVQNQMGAAQKSFERVLAVDPRAGVAANNLAWIYAEYGGNLDRALQLAQTAQRVLPNEAEVNDTLGLVYLKQGSTPSAVMALRRALDLDPRNANAAYHLALAYEQSGDRDATRRTLLFYLTLDPASARSSDARNRLALIKTKL